MSEDPERKFTQEELVGLFGDTLPIEVVNLLWNAPDGKTVGQIRTEVRAFAARQKPRVEDLVRRANKLVELMDDAESNHGGLIGGVTLRAKNELRLELSKWSTS